MPTETCLDSKCSCLFFFQAEDGIRDLTVTGVQTCALPIWLLAAREHLGIADGPGQGEVAGRQAYPLDAVLAGGFGKRGRGHGCGSAVVGKRTDRKSVV